MSLARVRASTLVGQSDEHLCSAEDAAQLGAPVHQDVVQPFLQLRDAARPAGFDIAILSGFRGFEQQLSIWNRKATGQRTVLDSNANPLDIATLSEVERSICLPRSSRKLVTYS